MMVPSVYIPSNSKCCVLRYNNPQTCLNIYKPQKCLISQHLVITLADKGVLRQDKSNNQTVKSQSLCENKNQNHTNK